MRSLADVRRFAVGGLFKPAGLEQTLEMLASSQADPIRAPARAQERFALVLMCDAIAIVVLHELGMDPSRLMATVEKLTRYNRKFFGATIDESSYPTLSDRRKFARQVTAWMARASPPRSSR